MKHYTYTQDNSGYVTFDELRQLTRKKLMLRRNDLSETELRALWCALDTDDSNQILQDEALRFLKLAPTRGRDSLADTNVRGGGFEARKKAKEAKKAAEEARAAAYNSVNIDAVSRTKDMRRALEADGVQPLDEYELLELSDNFNFWLEQTRMTSSTNDRAFSKVQGKSISWMLLFKEVDSDGECGEGWGLHAVAMLFVCWPPYRLPLLLLQRGLCCWPLLLLTALCCWPLLLPSTADADCLLLLPALSCYSPPPTHSHSPLTGSGGITYDEYKRVCRKKIGLRQADFPEQRMQLLWCALDIDNSDQVATR